MKTCIIEGCNKKHEAKGYCKNHYYSFRRYGNPLFYNPSRERHGKVNISEYNIWQTMKQRCYNPNNQKYRYYGARGIIVCKSWLHSFITFYEDMGPKPFPKAQIDRIDNDGNYEPGNCRWTTNKINTRNSSTVKYSIKVAQEIREKYATGKYSHRKLGNIYCIPQRTVGDMINRKIWI